MRFLGIEVGGRIPDANTIWTFRERLKDLGLTRVLFDRFNAEVARLGFEHRAGQMIDASFVEAPRQRNTREENETVKTGGTPESWKDKPAKLSQKDLDARWTKKNDETHYGYKNHVNADSAEKFVQDYAVTPASVHDSQVVDPILDIETVDGAGRKRALYADSAYRSQAREAALAAAGIPSQVHEKGARNRLLTEAQKASNTFKSRTRVRVEHVFAAESQMGGMIVRTIGLARAEVKIGMMNLVYNMKRLVSVMARNAATALRVLLLEDDRRGVPVMA
jgi:IS5 family transposase